MFQFGQFPRVWLLIHHTLTAYYHSRVSPFGHPRIKTYLPLPAAYRSLSRPSSAPSAKAFPLRSYSLDFLSFLNYVSNIYFFYARQNCFIPKKMLLDNFLFAFCCLFVFLFALFGFQGAAEQITENSEQITDISDITAIPRISEISGILPGIPDIKDGCYLPDCYLRCWLLLLNSACFQMLCFTLFAPDGNT